MEDEMTATDVQPAIKRRHLDSMSVPNHLDISLDQTPLTLHEFQKEAIWRQMQEYKGRYVQETERRAKADLRCKYLTSLLTVAVSAWTKVVSVPKTKGIRDEYLLRQIFDEEVAAETLESEMLAGFEAVKGVFDRSGRLDERFEIEVESNAILEGHLQQLKEDNSRLSTRLAQADGQRWQIEKRVLKLQSELERFKRRTPAGEPEGQARGSTPVEDSKETGATTREMELLKIELDSTKQLAQNRLAELDKEREDRLVILTELNILKERWRRMPEELSADPMSTRHLHSQLKHMQREVEERDARVDRLHRDIIEVENRKAAMVSELQTQLEEKRNATIELVTNLENEINRLRKDRDHMRQLYEQVNSQLAAVQRQISESEIVAEQLKYRLEGVNREQDRLSKGEQTDEQMLLAEIESIGKAFEELQEQNKRLIKQLAEKDEVNSRLVADKLKAEFANSQSQREAEISKQKAVKIEKLALDRALEAEGRERSLQRKLVATERMISEKSAMLDSCKRKMEDLSSQLSNLQHSLEHFKSIYDDKEIASRTRLIEEAQQERRKAIDELLVTRKKLEVYASSGVGLVRELQDELKAYRELMKCNSCHTRDKNVVLTKCMHTFCKNCIDIRLETRQRKCPNCGESFGANDVRPIYL